MSIDNHKYSDWDVRRVKELDIRQFIPGCNHRKTTQDIECPFCGKKKFAVNAKKDFNNAKCWVCGQGFSGPIAAVAYYSGINLDTDWLHALEETARQGGIVITPQERRREESIAAAIEASRQSFCNQQLEASGLTLEDVTASIIEGGQELFMPTFRKGRVNEMFVPDKSGDDMLIYYYRLDGKPMEYTSKGSSRPRQYVRVRWANPDIHRSSDGKPMKYQTPAGAPSRIYIPEKIRRLYKLKSHIDTLFLQEGEKKAEKACKHGMLSIGIQGINNFGSQQEGLLQDIQDIAKACSISNIVLVMDSDWNDLHRAIKVGDSVDKRPNSFSKAVIKFKQYMSTFHNIGLSVDIWWGHVNENDHGDKGVDDLLCGALLSREQELMEDIERTMHSHDGRGTWLNIHKITAISDAKIRDFWLLNDVHAFYEIHKARLTDVETFKIGNIRYKVENGSLVAVSRYSSATDIYTITQTAKGEDKVEFNDVEAFRFLAASGFHRLRNSDEAASGFEFIRIDDGIIDRVAPYEVRDFIRDYINSNCKSDLVLQFFAKRLSTIMADKQLENLAIIADDFNHFTSGVQRTYYNNGQVEITANAITPDKPISQVWRSRIVPRRFKRVPIIKDIQKVGDNFYIEYTPQAADCEFLSFLINTSNNFYSHDTPRELSDAETFEWIHHIVNKITTLGFLLCDYKYASERKAVIIQDHLMSEVGQSHGGAGKSIVGNAIGHIVSQFFIDGKQMKRDDEFLLSGVTKATRNIFIDDVKTNFAFENLFAMVTGPMYVNPKGKDRYCIPLEDSPKILITTNHAINKANENATKRRIIYMEFSTWYNPDHTLVDDFHHMFFDDWDDEQWNLFDNLMAECVMYYFRSFENSWTREGAGAVPPPMKNIELRTLRQEMSEVLYQWAEEYFDPSGTHLNDRIKRADLVASFFEYAGGPAGHGVTRTNFKGKIQAYCKFKGYDFNIDRPNSDKAYYSDWKRTHPDESFIGSDDKAGGAEYFKVYSPVKEKELKPF
ncbi:hypothetical protein [Muribaculum intestinale]|uniref:hypothetical protein n=1 Tax=Muribaculum intestinale TaxID=1796646 RepID=UPI0025A9E402|nr:hypothetical protein [Muribaculum intestinale]